MKKVKVIVEASPDELKRAWKKAMSKRIVPRNVRPK